MTNKIGNRQLFISQIILFQCCFIFSCFPSLFYLGFRNDCVTQFLLFTIDNPNDCMIVAIFAVEISVTFLFGSLQIAFHCPPTQMYLHVHLLQNNKLSR